LINNITFFAAPLEKAYRREPAMSPTTKLKVKYPHCRIPATDFPTPSFPVEVDLKTSMKQFLQSLNK
jgi:hypothetical protein